MIGRSRSASFVYVQILEHCAGLKLPTGRLDRSLHVQFYVWYQVEIFRQTVWALSGSHIIQILEHCVYWVITSFWSYWNSGKATAKKVSWQTVRHWPYFQVVASDRSQHWAFLFIFMGTVLSRVPLFCLNRGLVVIKIVVARQRSPRLDGTSDLGLLCVFVSNFGDTGKTAIGDR